MKTTIYYFTGTGNSLKIARGICDRLEDCNLVPIAKVWQEENLAVTSEKVGFIFPLYYSGLPKIVYDFVNKIDLSKSNYFFTVVVSAGGTIKLPFQQLEKILNTKTKKLHLGYIIVMPTNYVIAYDIFSENRQNLLFEIRSDGNKPFVLPCLLKRLVVIFFGFFIFPLLMSDMSQVEKECVL